MCRMTTHRAAGQPRAGVPRRVDDDRGLALLEAVLTVPVAFVMILAVLQTGLWWYGRQLAATAADQAARSARAYQATNADGTASGTIYLDQVDGHGSSVLLGPRITVDRGATTVTVHVYGHIPALLPFLPTQIDEQATGPIETFQPAP
jgi:Flp pilus assembly protein TadG